MNNLIFRKAVDLSIFKYGFAIPTAKQKVIFDALNYHVQKGETYPINIIIDNTSYSAIINNIDFTAQRKSDVVHIRYSENSKIATKLQAVFSSTHSLVSEYLRDHTNESSHIVIPKSQQEYIELYFMEVPGTFRLKCITKESQSLLGVTSGFVPSFPIGAEVTNGQLRLEFACGNMGGMRRSKENNSLVIISDSTKSIYEDKWHGNVLHYTGMGLIGDQVLEGNQNKTLYESRVNGVALHLFEVFEPTRYIYQGPVELYEKPYQETQLDQNGNERLVWMFPIRVKNPKPIDQRVLDLSYEQKQKKASRLSVKELKMRADEHKSDGISNRSVTSNVYIRDVYVSEYTKQSAKGLCELCRQSAPFVDKQGEPYLETHHIIWLSEGGEDTIHNTVALCPNCHRKMHIVNDSGDIDFLQDKARRR